MARYYRRGHWVNAPGKRASKNSAWLVGGLIALALYALSQGGGDHVDPQQQPAAPASVAPAQTP